MAQPPVASRRAAVSTKDPAELPRRPSCVPERGKTHFRTGGTPCPSRSLLVNGCFLYLLLGKSHFKDLCSLEAKLFFCQWNAVFYYDVIEEEHRSRDLLGDERTDWGRGNLHSRKHRPSLYFCNCPLPSCFVMGTSMSPLW